MDRLLLVSALAMALLMLLGTWPVARAGWRSG